MPRVASPGASPSMSFRNRLTLFFVLIVIVPMVAVAFVLFSLIEDNERGKADARVAARQEVAIGLVGDARAQSGRAAEAIGARPAVAAALRSGDPDRIRTALDDARRDVRATRVSFVGATGRPRVDVGARVAAFSETRQLQDRDGTAIGRLEVAVTDAPRFARLVQRATGLEVVVGRGTQVLAATLDGSGAVRVPEGTGRVEVGGRELRSATIVTDGREFGAPTRITLLDDREDVRDDAAEARLLAGAILVGFFVLAFTFAVLVSRSLQRQIEGFLDAARRLGRGDFTAEVPIQGRDEFAQLGDEFNRMSGELERRLEELQAERARLEQSLRRIGETFAANLDRDGLLEIVAETAVDGVAARGGRALVVEGADLREVARAGDQDGEGLERAVEALEREVLRSGVPAHGVEHGIAVLSHPLRTEERLTGLLTVWRPERRFAEGEQELFAYLARQAAVSIDNVQLHQTVERQATTDELTGLSNRRRFQEALGVEVERSRRFGSGVGLVLLDIDNFKKVNDTYGHQTGDVVLREVAQVLRATSREIDVPARYGGEELAVVLPGTDVEGAFEMAERIREGIQELVIPVVGGDGSTLQVTASFGVASVPRTAQDERGLVAAADEALYAAKHAGKNQTARAA
jgi:diguanylate cyclase (GGDEF)-like protein